MLMILPKVPEVQTEKKRQMLMMLPGVSGSRKPGVANAHDAACSRWHGKTRSGRRS